MARKYATHAEKLRVYRLRDPEKHRRKRQEWREANRERTREIARNWYSRNKLKARLGWTIRDARLRNAAGSFTKADIDEILDKQRGRCAVCKAKLNNKFHIDHIQPLSRGGSNYRRNLPCLCATCNLSKNARDPISFMQSRGYLL